MSIFVPNKVYLRGILLHYFIQKKSAAEAHRILVQTYDDNALSHTTCRDWFRRFKNNDFELAQKWIDSWIASKDMSFFRRGIHVLPERWEKKSAAEAHRILVQTHWVPYELKPRTTASTAEKKRFFASHRIVTGDEKWIHYDNPKRRKSWGKHIVRKTKYPWLEASSLITGDRYRVQLMRLSRALKEKRPLYAQRHDKVILLHDNARPHVAKPVKTYLETLKWEVLTHPLYSPDIVSSDFHLFRSMVHGLADRRFHSYEEAQKWIDSWIASKDMSFFRRGIHVLPERWEKVVSSDGQYFK
ncbi:MOS1T transposase, partial [Pseudoatta argentina]